MIQSSDASTLVELVKNGGPPAIALAWIFVYHKFIAPKPNGEEFKREIAEQVRKEAKEQQEHHTKEVLFKLDLALTEHFDQLRRDLELKIDKAIENGIQAYLFQRYEMQSRRKDDR